MKLFIYSIENDNTLCYYKHIITKKVKNEMKINKDNHIPLYLQTTSAIMNEIRSGNWVQGNKLPSEKELCLKYGVSMITIRNALKELNQEGVIYKIQGKGSFVAKHYELKHDLRFQYLKSFTEEMSHNNKSAGAILISTKHEMATAEDILLFDIEENSFIQVIKRVRTVNNSPTHISTHRIPIDLYKKLGDFDLTGSIYNAFELAGLKIKDGTEEIAAIMPSPSDAEILGINAKQPVIESVSVVSSDIRTVMHTRSVINHNRLKIKIDLIP